MLNQTNYESFVQKDSYGYCFTYVIFRILFPSPVIVQVFVLSSVDFFLNAHNFAQLEIVILSGASSTVDAFDSGGENV